MFRVHRAAERDFSVWRFPALRKLLPIFLEYWSQCQYQNSTAKFGQKKSNVMLCITTRLYLKVFVFAFFVIVTQGP